jgi:glycine/D-amino acid oxidase-like deaminating enzyme
MELTAGYPYWLIRDGLPFSYPKLLENATAKVSIIGGGISGALAAYFLTEAGIDCILLDGRTIGLGSTCASTSLLQYELDEPLHLLVDKVGENQARKAYQLCGNSIDILKDIMVRIGFNEYDSRNSLFFSSRSTELSFMKKEYEARRNAGFKVTLLSNKEILNAYGMLAENAILSEQGATINAYALTHALLQYCIARGLRVFDRSKISRVQYSEHEVKLETEDGYIVQSAKLVNASGFEIIHFLEKNIVKLYCTYAVVSENQQEKKELWKDRVMIWNTANPYLYIRLTRDNRILIGGRDEPYNTRSSRELYKKKAILLQKDFSKLFPEINFTGEFSWSGTFGKTKDSLPFIGDYKKTPNTYYALGFGGNGITFSVIAAQIISDLIMGIKNENAEIFSFGRKSI